MNDKDQSLLSLHKYWLQANRMREDLVKEMEKLPENTDIEDLYTYCLSTNNIFLHTYRDFWLANLSTVIEGYKRLNLHDNTIDDLLSNNEKGIAELKEFRNSTHHFELPLERNKKLKKLTNLSIIWIQDVHLAFNEYLFYRVLIKTSTKECE